MSRLKPILGSLVFLALAPGTVAGLAPYAISHWTAGPPLFGLGFLSFMGWLLLAGGLLILLDSFARFALQGEGTPAPPFPTQRLIVNSFYRHVRNPMYVAVLALIFGQALIFGNMLIIAYGTLIFFAFHTFILIYEEPTLRRSYPHDYESYFANVPRWLPRLSPWKS
ncbi:MAG: isoprenylcysteine carboxylmethyltransferase family protein [Parvibaculum sp.]|nr:isoprenylcysteine carboxylmethyltransferase family protein [Parvibaculum sp.]